MRNQRQKQAIENFQHYHTVEHDSCGIICVIEKTGTPTRQNVDETIRSLIQMEHRSGFIDGEGDGCGILTDIPRALWSAYLDQAGLDHGLAFSEQFAVAHLFVPRTGLNLEEVQTQIRQLFFQHHMTILLERQQQVTSDFLGKNGKQDEPLFWQLAVISADGLTGYAYAQQLYELQIAIEHAHAVHVASLSPYTTAYKVLGAASILPRYFHDLADERFVSSVTIGHNRYSTNTLSSFFRVQPFSLLGHNGEINTISKLEEEARLLGVPLVDGGSDSQNLNRTLETFIHRYRLSLFEAMETVFPPIHHEMKNLPAHLQDLYAYLRQAWGHFAQGPAAIVSRHASECLFSVDALGLRPLWMVESTASFYLSSEQGVIPVHQMASEPKSLAPGEKVGVLLHPDRDVEVVPHHKLQQLVYDRFTQKTATDGWRQHLHFAYQTGPLVFEPDMEPPASSVYSAYGWDREQIQLVEQMSANGAEPIRSLGHDGPLAALSKERQNLADYIKESVAVVTNPAIDRDREIEHFSTRVVIGSRVPLSAHPVQGLRLELPSPVLVEGQTLQKAAQQQGTLSLEQVIHYLHNHPASISVVSTSFSKEEGLKTGLNRLQQEVTKAVKNGAVLVVLDDTDAHRGDRYWIDPLLATAAADQALKSAFAEDGDNLRRRASLVLRSGSIRSLHDLALAVGMGADAISPYLMFAAASAKSAAESAINLYSALNKGLEKVTSTIGIHELRGYGRLFASIGLNDEVAAALSIVNFCGSARSGLSFAELEADSIRRYHDYTSESAREAKTFHIFPRLWKLIGQVAAGDIPYADYAQKLEENERENPIALRHLTDFAWAEKPLPETAGQVDISVGDHSLPFLISSMSFGSQNETAFRAYAEAADQLNMISMNGEGGEIKDMLGRYRKTRGIQVASGRFGINIELANAADILEIKIGQGAKPGEGGHLPGSKVTAKIAAARNATIGSDLISPSNNHDIYSIEDLAQMITELKTANHEAKVCVKVPIVPGIGTIAVGIAKAGADFITLSGFDGGTGAARVHALQHVGLPAEIGVKTAHNALLEAGLRDQVELWADGGVKSAVDVVKLMLLGANRVGFGTLAMIAVGCTTCRGCHLDTCHVGIATQIDSLEEAHEKGLRRFVPRELDRAVGGLKNFFTLLAEEVRRLTAALGFSRTQELVGRSDLLVQSRLLERVDLASLLALHPLFTRHTPATGTGAVEEHRVVVTAGAAALTGEADAGTLATALADDRYYQPDDAIHETFASILSGERVLGSRWSGARVKQHLDGSYASLPEVSLHFTQGSIPGNGLAAYNARGVNIRVEGGAQDGVGKTGFGGRVSILKAKGARGTYLNGSVGKSFCYGAQKGLFLVQGNADSRACIRLSGADVVFGGEITQPLNDQAGGIAARANLKGFAFEYMTNGRAVVLGDPGPWICAGMTGGVIYIRQQPELGFDRAALERRIAKGAKVFLHRLNETGTRDVRELLTAYKEELLATEQFEMASRIHGLIEEPEAHFLMISPKKEQADPSVSTE
ncbi:glutamate synthase-related protein [Brevibacillus ruminantium]|uniref:Glutamate synthase-related protein n=1 Tax=Brevibacillus ruminantium TaxID=2950604 RepID=A0ABY4WF24_9BACL|nr:glutamate synthase-related protein [Brevibacillus ruminantium]USG64733.1 glutamate synthase-related protein [Brevibacillus ruminantium]